MNFTRTAAALLAAAALSLSALSAQAEGLGSERHVARGIACTMCHGQNNEVAFPDENACLKCHQRDVVVEKTKHLSTNPHKAPHNGDCTMCHMMHEPEVDYCAQCHQFNFKMPNGVHPNK